MPVTKYKKIKSHSRSQGIKNVDRYIDDENKTRREDVPVREYDLGDIRDLSDYVENEAKTINPENYKKLVTVINASSVDGFVDDCTAAEQLYRLFHDEHLREGQKANDAFHFIFSVKGTDADPVDILNAAAELAQSLAGDEFAAKVAVHLNTGNYHAHIVINAYANDGSHKFKDEWNLYKKVRDISDRISLMYGFEIIESRDKAADKVSRLDYDSRKSAKGYLKEDIKECISRASGFDDYCKRMEEKGWKLNEKGGCIRYSKGKTGVYDYSLGTDYLKENIEKKIRERLENQAEYEKKKILWRKENDLEFLKASVPKYTRSGHRIPFLIRFLLLIKKYMELAGDRYFDEAFSVKHPSILNAKSTSEKEEMVKKAIKVLAENKIETFEDLEAALLKSGMEGRIASRDAESLFSTASQMEEILDALSHEEELKTVMESLGIEDKDFNIKASESDKRKAKAGLSPMDSRQKRKLYKLLDGSPFRLAFKYDEMTKEEAKEAIDWLEAAGIKETEEGTQEEAYQSLEEKVRAAAKRSFSVQSFEKLSERQLSILEKSLPADIKERIDLGSLTAPLAERLISLCRKTDLGSLKLKEPAAGSIPDAKTLEELSDLKKLHQDAADLGDLDISKVDKYQARTILNTYYSAYDSYEAVLSDYDKLIKERLALAKRMEKAGSMPSSLLSYEEYGKCQAAAKLKQYADRRSFGKSDKPVSEKTAKKAETAAPALAAKGIDFAKLTPALADRIIALSTESLDISSLSYGKKPPMDTHTRFAIEQLALLHPELKGISQSNLGQYEADRLFAFYLKPYDSEEKIIRDYEKLTGEKILPEEKRPTRIKLTDYTDEEQACILAYLRILKAKELHSLSSPEEIKAFKDIHESLVYQAAKTVIKSDSLNNTYKDLNFAKRVLEKCEDPKFVFGIDYEGEVKPKEKEEEIQREGTEREEERKEMKEKSKKI